MSHMQAIFPAWQTFYHLSSNQQSPCVGDPLNCRCSPACARQPEANQHGLSTDSYALKNSPHMIPDAGSFCTGTCYCRSYTRHSPTHHRPFGTCLPASN
ncbi:hypothetical protein O181_042001 [Austropuccinia psidii MF-1]|uniref:Uncharacterized protein n=1 Tax=Austropuccinia psidii MF-1 TaxID=1389203 RepID=A0A9Q3HEQ9_9BASI|nr:hypothetical protein [Austropuccinia psidii MF-1]